VIVSANWLYHPALAFAYRSPVVMLLSGSLVVYTLVAAAQRWWPSAVIAPILATLLWTAHRRARFSAYVFFSVMAARGALTTHWALSAYALAAIALMQTPAARRAWPRLTRGGDRMRRP
jgi:hypothetical protein